MHADLNVAGAIGEVNKWIAATESPTKADAEALLQIDDVLGVLELEAASEQETTLGVFIGIEPDAEVEALLAKTGRGPQGQGLRRVRRDP